MSFDAMRGRGTKGMATGRRRRGYTLAELMISAGLLVILSGAAAALAAHIHTDSRTAVGYGDDLRGLRTALERIETELRSARTVTWNAGMLTLTHAADEPVVYTIADDALVRSTTGRTLVVTRAIASLDVELDGELARIRLTVASRRSGRSASPSVSSVVRLRCLGDAR